MKNILVTLTVKVGNWIYIRLRLLLPQTSTARLLHMLGIGLSLAGAIGSHYQPQWIHGVDPFLAHFLAPPTTHASLQTQICAPFGGKESVRLDDGSSAELDSGACIAVEMTPTERTVTLEPGEAIFQVARDPTRPFVVKAGPLAIRALGTRFDVYRKTAATLVSVIEGSVQLSSLDTAPRASTKPLNALQQIEVPDDTAQSANPKGITPDEFSRATAWLDGKISLDHLTLAEAFEELNRYQHIQVVFQDPHIADLRFDGDLHTNVAPTHLLRILKFRCVHGDYNESAHRITLSNEPGKHAGNRCP